MKFVPLLIICGVLMGCGKPVPNSEIAAGETAAAMATVPINGEIVTTTRNCRVYAVRHDSRTVYLAEGKFGSFVCTVAVEKITEPR